MIASRWCVVLLLVLLVLPRAVRAQQPEACASAIPGNIQAGLFTQDVLALLQGSPTFRAQCERIASARNVRVDLSLVRLPGTARAETTIDRYKSGALRAHVQIAPGADYRALIAHEFEHIIEQIDGVNLREEAATGRAWLVDRNVFETRRASETGDRVRRELQQSEAHAAAVVHDLR
jgi:hypothetical protein